MNLSFDTIIVGCGLAGACAAFELSARERILIIDQKSPGSGASGIPIGLVSPLMARRARPVWRMEEAVHALNRLLRESNTDTLFRREGVLKPACHDEQAEAFRDAAQRWQEHGIWHAAAVAHARWPYLAAPFGVLEVTSGGSIGMPEFCQGLIDVAVGRGAQCKSGTSIVAWKEYPDHVEVTLQADSTERLRAGRLLLAIGAGYLEFPELAALHLHPIKGQWIRLKSDDSVRIGSVTPVSSRRYVAEDGDDYIAGSTYEHEYTDLAPTDEAAARLKSEAAELVPELKLARIVDSSAAIRVTVPGVRLPMVGPLPGRKRIWIFTGLGSKGLLMAPLLAGELIEFFTERKDIPNSIRVN